MNSFTVVRDFNDINGCGDIGFIRIYMVEDFLMVSVTQIHDYGQAIIYVNYDKNINLFDCFLSILDKITNDYPMETHNGYKDVIENNDTVLQSWDCIEFNRDNLSYVLRECSIVDYNKENDRNMIILRGTAFINSGTIIFEYDEPLINTDDTIEKYILSRKKREYKTEDRV
jgi:hypothetical protein